MTQATEKSIVHIVGNGPSKSHFRNDPQGIVMGCNYGEPSINDMQWVFIHDSRVFKNIERLRKPFPYNVIIRHNFDSLASKLKQDGLLVKEIKLLPPQIREKSSGHDAIHYFIGNVRFNELHIWGFDSILHDDMSSDSKEKIRGSAQILKLLPGWKHRFNQLFEAAKRNGTRILVHDREGLPVSVGA